ncbi:MAG: hypothetical protein HKN07_04660, partial [Acidimicrobiia bacterium]|nr:hypothetical protein [Acidimicrobiia bacterium]
DPHWQTVQVLGDGSFTVDAVIEDSKTMAVQAWFDRTDRLGSSVSDELTLIQSFLR